MEDPCCAKTLKTTSGGGKGQPVSSRSVPLRVASNKKRTTRRFLDFFLRLLAAFCTSLQTQHDPGPPWRRCGLKRSGLYSNFTLFRPSELPKPSLVNWSGAQDIFSVIFPFLLDHHHHFFCLVSRRPRLLRDLWFSSCPSGLARFSFSGRVRFRSQHSSLSDASSQPHLQSYFPSTHPI